MVSVSSHIDLKNSVSDFWHIRLLFFCTRIKLEERKKIELPVKKRHTFLMRGVIRIRRQCLVGECSENIRSKFQPIWSWGCQLGTRNVRTLLHEIFATR